MDIIFKINNYKFLLDILTFEYSNVPICIKFVSMLTCCYYIVTIEYFGKYIFIFYFLK